MNDSFILNNILHSCNELISSEDFKTAYRIGNSFTRSRKLSFSNALYFILGASKKALPANLAEFKDANPDFLFPYISRQAFSKARSGIHHEAFKELFRLSVRSFYQLSSNLNKWKDYLVLAVDGTTLQLPDTAESGNTFGFIKNQNSCGRAISSASELYDVLNDIIIDVTIGRYGFSERKFALQHLESLSCLDYFQDSIITFDRGYPSQELFHEMNSRGIKFVIRAASSFKISNKRFEPDTVFQNTFKGDSMTLRCINLTLPGGNKEQFIAKLLTPSYSIDDFQKLEMLFSLHHSSTCLPLLIRS